VFSCFVVFINEFFTFFSFNITPNFYPYLSTIFVDFYSKISFGLKRIFFGNSAAISHFDDVRYSQRGEVRYSNYNISRTRLDESSSSSNQNYNSFYGRIAQQNPYMGSEHSYVDNERIPHPSHYPPQNYTPENSYQYSNYNSSEPNYDNQENSYRVGSRSNSNSPRYFVIDSFDENGQVVRYSYNTSNGDYNVIHNAYPVAPEISNLTTPNTMTPLFQSSSNIGENSYQSSQASLGTNDTNHGTIGENRSENHIN
jgi:hypothetical protein